ncbi:MAG TPA: YgiQ family radical SAM protein [Bacteroidales bacterium]|nr:YgiQ family radical SAM protein [Bacteroidales bacterium]
MHSFLPVTKKEVEKLGWENIDVILFSGDAYIDHPAFGSAVIARIIESVGLKVAIVPQPNWQDDLRDFKKFGKPTLFFAVTSGNMDSMVNHYTANKRLRSDDAFTPGNKHGARPDYAVNVYCNILKKLYPDVPIVIGGIEASLRRLCHYDYWSDHLKPSILLESKADLLLYGMAEKTLIELLEKLKNGISFQQIKEHVQSAIVLNEKINQKHILLPSYEECLNDKKAFALAYRLIEENSSQKEPEILVQKHGDKYVTVFAPALITSNELDSYYQLPYTRQPHPKYQKKEPIPAFEMIKNSITIHRGCFGGCSFCSLAIHQGKFIVSRSLQSIEKEVDTLSQMDYFKGHISDLGGPSANMYRMNGINEELCKKCKRPSCIYPNICANLETNPSHLLELYRKVRAKKNIKKVTIGSGIRYDIHIRQLKNKIHAEYLKELIIHHVSGRLKVAPEHIHEQVLKLMFKPSFDLFKEFYIFFENINRQHQLKQQIIPYFISNHPGSTIECMVELSQSLKKMNIKPEQVQDFTPTPMTLASVMYYSGINPYTLKPVYVAKKMYERQLQKELFFWYLPDNKKQIEQKLLSLQKKHLIKYFKR